MNWYRQIKISQVESSPADLGYEEYDGMAEHVICSSEPVQSITCHDMSEFDPDLKGYYGIFIGDAEEWLPVLARDDYCNGDAYIFDIDTSLGDEPWFWMEDSMVIDRTSTPDSVIIFSKYPEIPSEMVTLREVIPEDKIEPAEDLFGEYYGEE